MVSFELNEEQRMMRDSVGAFAREEIRPAARDADETGAIPAELIAKAWQLGLVQGPIPERLGGNGDARSAVSGAIIVEELAWGDLAIALHALAPQLLAFPVLESGSDEQRERHLKRLAGAEFAPATAALMEPRWDFDASAFATSARRDGSGFALSGRKCLVPLASKADTVLVWAAQENGVGGFLVGRDTPGLKIGEREKNMGLKALETFELELDGVRVGPEARLGGGGAINFNRVLSQSRVAMGAMGVGLARAAFEYARDYARERRAFGVPIATKQAVAFMLADMAIEIDAARLLVWEAAWHLDRGADSFKESYLARNYVAAAALKVTDNAVQVLGGHGYIREHPVELWLRNARGLSAIEGLATV
jgi:alkylation response protein AidB-like acyl-CoA dehydrogenase